MNTDNLVLVRSLLAVAALALGGCATPVKTSDPPPSGVIAAPEGGASGYQHGADRSRFSVGAGSLRATEHGYFKLTGAEGTLALDQFNGSVYGVPKAASSAQKLPPLGKAPAEHDAFVLDYFRKSGVPADQIGAVQSRMLVEVTGRSDEKERAVPHVTGYYSVLQRVVEGIPVADSFAWARANAEGKIVEEGVYWPALSRETLAQARQLRAAWSDEKRRNALAERIHGQDPRAHVAIRHSSASSHDPFEAIACVDVYVNVATPGDESQAKSSAAQSQVAYIRHFDIGGAELHLPQERFHLTNDFPARKTAPAKAVESAR
jgi:hypothetical protein